MCYVNGRVGHNKEGFIVQHLKKIWYYLRLLLEDCYFSNFCIWFSGLIRQCKNLCHQRNSNHQSLKTNILVALFQITQSPIVSNTNANVYANANFYVNIFLSEARVFNFFINDLSNIASIQRFGFKIHLKVQFKLFLSICIF